MSTVHYKGVAISIENGCYYIGYSRPYKTLGEAKAEIARIKKQLKK